MNDPFQDFAGQFGAFQKIWFESMSRLMQAGFSVSPNSTPPEFVRHARDASLNALGKNWDDFLRSPQFQDGMKKWMDNTIALREMSNDFMAKIRQELQAPSNEDIEAIQLSLRHLETRVLNRLEALSKQIEGSEHCAGTGALSPDPDAAKRAHRRPHKNGKQKGAP